MRRWLILFILAVMPLQFSWAAVAGYCQHETAKRAHFGHHQHAHQEASTSQVGDDALVTHVDDSSDSTKNPLTPDDDCAFCHLGCAQILVDSTSSADVRLPLPQVARPSAPRDSHIPGVPVRPDRRLA